MKPEIEIDAERRVRLTTRVLDRTGRRWGVYRNGIFIGLIEKQAVEIPRPFSVMSLSGGNWGAEPTRRAALQWVKDQNEGSGVDGAGGVRVDRPVRRVVEAEQALRDARKAYIEAIDLAYPRGTKGYALLCRTQKRPTAVTVIGVDCNGELQVRLDNPRNPRKSMRWIKWQQFTPGCSA